MANSWSNCINSASNALQRKGQRISKLIGSRVQQLNRATLWMVVIVYSQVLFLMIHSNHSKFQLFTKISGLVLRIGFYQYACTTVGVPYKKLQSLKSRSKWFYKLNKCKFKFSCCDYQMHLEPNGLDQFLVKSVQAKKSDCPRPQRTSVVSPTSVVHHYKKVKRHADVFLYIKTYALMNNHVNL